MKLHASSGTIALISLCVFLAGLTHPAAAQDVELFGVAKSRDFVQDSSMIVRLDDWDGDPLLFEAFVEEAPGGDVSSATVTPPGGSAINLPGDGSEFFHEFSTDWPIELEDNYPNGDYLLQVQTGGGPVSATVTLAGDAYPNIPRVSNFAAAQAINSAAGFTLTWDAFAGGTIDDVIEVRIVRISDSTDNEIFSSGPVGSGLDGTATSFLVPAATLDPGSRYQCELSFIKVVELDTGSGSPAVAVYIAETSVPMATSGPPSETDPPWLRNSRPFFDEPGVPVESVVAFEFSEAMNPVVFPKFAWSGSGLNPLLFSYHWNADGSRLFAVYGAPVGLPQGTEVSWEINPMTGGGSIVSDLAGNPLPSHGGSFHTAAAAASGDPDVDSVFLVKAQGLFQDASGVQPSGLFGFETGGDLNTLNGLLAGTVTVPGGGTLDLLGEWFGDSLDNEADYPSKAELDQFFPNGSYQVSLTTAHDGIKNATVDFPADNYPNDPTLTGIASLQAVDPDQPLTISWLPFAGAADTSDYFIWLWISSESGFDVYESPDSGEPGALTGTSTSVVIPAGTLSPGRSYEAELEFVRIVDTDDTAYPGVVIGAGFSKITEFELQTTGTPIQPRAEIIRSPGSTEIRVTGDRYTNYLLEASSSLQSWHQIQYPMQTWDSNEVTFFDWDASYFTERYYRAIEDSGDGNQSQPPVSIQGTVLHSDDITPIAGALVATSLDGNTATTDANGSFFLQTDTTRPPNQAPYSIIITRTGFQDFNENSNWGDQPRNNEFYLQPLP